MPISTPNKISVPWATSGLKNTIPATSDPLTGLAGYDQGFTAINMTPKTAGGIPPFGQDFNGIFYAVTEALRYLETGALFPYDGTFATGVGGYPLGALLQRTDGYGLWRNISANNTTDPEAFGAGWAPEGAGATSVAMSNANVTLSALQAARTLVIITGTLTANLNLVFPTYQKEWIVLNSATGDFAITAKTAAGSGVAIPTGASAAIYGDGTNILAAGATLFASAAEAQAFAVPSKAISPATLASAFQGANSLLSPNGYQKFPGGLIVQWCRVLGTAASPSLATATFPIAFPNGLLGGSVSVEFSPTNDVRANFRQAMAGRTTSIDVAAFGGSGVSVAMQLVVVGY